MDAFGQEICFCHNPWESVEGKKGKKAEKTCSSHSELLVQSAGNAIEAFNHFWSLPAIEWAQSTRFG